MKQRIVLTVTLCVVFFLSIAGYALASEALSLNPGTVEIGITYGGKTVAVTGRVPSGEECMIRVVGQEHPLHLKEKGKVWGILWMNVASLSYEEVPDLYFVRSSSPLSELTSSETLDTLMVGYEALKHHAAPETGSEENRLFGEMIKLKEHEGLYSVMENTITRTPGQDGMDTVEATLDFPPKAPVGDYEVELVSFKNGKQDRMETATITLARSPFITWMSSLAVNKGLLYGIFAVIIALGSGLLTGVIFGMGGKGGH